MSGFSAFDPTHAGTLRRSTPRSGAALDLPDLGPAGATAEQPRPPTGRGGSVPPWMHESARLWEEAVAAEAARNAPLSDHSEEDARAALATAAHEAGQADGYSRGIAAGRREAAEAIEGSLALAVSAIERCIEDAASQARRDAGAAGGALARAVFAAVHAAIPVLATRHGAEEVERLVAETTAALTEETKVTVRVAPQMAGAMEARFKAGLLTVEADPDVALGDARIEWPGGVLARDTKTQRKAVLATLAALGLAKEG